MDDADTTTSTPSSSSGGGLGGILGSLGGQLGSSLGNQLLGGKSIPSAIQVPSTLPTHDVVSGLGMHSDLDPLISTTVPTLVNIDVAAGYENVARILATPRPMSTGTITAAQTELITNPSEFFKLDPVKNRIKYFRGATFTLCLKVHVTANAFCSGASVIKYIPFGFNPNAVQVSTGASQHFPGDFMDLNNTSDYELRIPYIAPYRMYDINSLFSDASDNVAGHFQHTIINSGPEPISYKVFLWLEDLQLFYPIIPEEVETQGFKEKSITESGHRLVVSGERYIDDVQGLPSNIKILNPTPVTTLLDDASPDTFSSLLTRPSFKNTMTPENTVFFKLQKTDDIFHRENFTFIYPSCAFTAISLLPFFFQYWACSYEVTFKFFKTQFHKGLIAFYFVPMNIAPSDTLNYADHYHEILDLSQADSVTIKIPFISDNSRFILGDSPGTLVCRQIVPLSAPDTVSAYLPYTVSLRACDDLVYSLPNMNPFSPYNLREPVPVETQGILGPEMPIPPEYNAAGPCSISQYFTFATRALTSVASSFFFSFIGTNTSRNLVMPPRIALSNIASHNRFQWLVECYYGYRGEIVSDVADELFIYDKYGQLAPRKALTPYLSNLKYAYTWPDNPDSAPVYNTHAAMANFQGFYQWFIPNVIPSNQEWHATFPTVHRM
jgi:hypothetical protein